MAVTFSYDCGCNGPCTHIRFEGNLYDDWRDIVEDLVQQRDSLLNYIEDEHEQARIDG